jgi:hypothetical protein
VEITPILEWLQQSGIAVRIRDGLFLFPLLESAHVVGLTIVFGTIAIVDLRLLGLASTHRSFQRLSSDVLKWTWVAFALTAVTGGLMFMTNATVYFHNTYFRAKVVLLVLAAINVGVFEWTAGRTVRQWDEAPSAPPVARTVAVMSLVIWVAVIVTGRMIGFTTSRVTLNTPAPVDTNFEELLGLPDSGPTSPPAKE